MRRTHLVESRFRGVYVGLALIWVASSLALLILADSWLIPRIILHRASEVESLIHSQRERLIYKDHRTLRDELLNRGILPDDRGFDELWPDADKKSIEDFLKSCRLLSPNTCSTSNQAMIFLAPATEGIRASTFVISLKTDYFSSVPGMAMAKVMGVFAMALVFGFVGWGIRRQERFLMESIRLLTSSITKIDAIFSMQASNSTVIASSEDFPNKKSAQVVDDFAIISKSIDHAALLLNERTRQIEEYKRRFEKKTQLEQLAQTISYSSHNLLAPFLEGVDFLKALPDRLNSVPEERLLRSAKSLENRLQQGASTLRAALQSTKESYSKPEQVSLNALLRDFKLQIELSPLLASARVELSTSLLDDQLTVVCNPPEIAAALWNLFRNSHDGKGDTQIKIRTFVDQDMAVIHFRDDGPGIPEPLLDRVFEDFYTTKSSGTGLGLASVRTSLQQMGGSIRALPIQPGALFEMKLPLSVSLPGGSRHA